MVEIIYSLLKYKYLTLTVLLPIYAKITKSIRCAMHKGHMHTECTNMNKENRKGKQQRMESKKNVALNELMVYIACMSSIEVCPHNMYKHIGNFHSSIYMRKSNRVNARKASRSFDVYGILQVTCDK